MKYALVTVVKTSEHVDLDRLYEDVAGALAGASDASWSVIKEVEYVSTPRELPHLTGAPSGPGFWVDTLTLGYERHMGRGQVTIR